MRGSGGNGKQGRRIGSAHVIAIVALVFAIASGAYAAGLAKDSVGSRQIKEDAVKSSELGDAAVGTTNLKSSATTTQFSDDDEPGLTVDQVPVTIASLDLPAGNYLVLGNLNAVANENGTDLICVIDDGGGVADSGRIALQSGLVSAGSPKPANAGRMPLQAGITLSSAGPVSIACNSSVNGVNVDLSQIHLDAIRTDARVNQ